MTEKEFNEWDMKLSEWRGYVVRALEDSNKELIEIKENLKVMEETNVKIDKIVLDKKIPKEQFKKKIDLSGKCDEPDPTYQIMTNSRKYFEKMTYMAPPKEIIFPKNKGNQPLPADLLNQINFRG